MKYFSMFSGIGGFELAIWRAHPFAECVGYSELDKYAIQIYEKQFDHKNFGDATTLDPKSIPQFDLLVGGFPCQSFSIAGRRGGFADTRGTLFFDISRVLHERRPEHFILENVKGLLSHDTGKTFRTIITTLAELGYSVEWQVLNSKNFGVPQNRERVFIVGHLRTDCGGQVFPFTEDDRVSDQSAKPEGTQPQAEISTTVRIGMGTKADSTYVVPGKIDHDEFKPTKDESLCITANYFKGPDNHGQRTVVGTLRTHKDGQGFREVQSGLAPTIPARAREDGSGQPVVAIPVQGIDRPEWHAVQRRG